MALRAFGDILLQLLYYLQIMILIRAFLSFLVRDYSSPIYSIIYTITEPFLSPFRQMLPKTSMGIDFSPVLCYMFIWVLRTIIISI